MSRTLTWLTIFRSSFLQTAGSAGFWAMVVTCILSSFASILHNHQGYLQATEHYKVELQERQRLQFLSTGPNGRDTDRSLRVIRPPSPAAIFVVGVERTMPAGWDFGPAGVETLPPYWPQEPLAAFDILTDGESVVRLFGGMLAIVVGFWTVIRDRQTGWLTAGTWLPVSPGWLMSALLTAGAGVLGLVSFVWISTSVLFAFWLLDSAIDQPLSLVDTWLMAWTYLMIMFSTGVIIARRTRNPLLGMLAVVGTWTVLIFLGPQLAATALQLSSETVPRISLEQQRRENYSNKRKVADDALAAGLVAATINLGKLELDTAFDKLFPELEPTWRDEMRRAREESDEANQRWLEDRSRWVQRLQSLARITPGTLLQSALATANGQSWSTYREWEAAIANHEAALNRALFDDRSTLNLRIHWRDSVIPWTHIWHELLPHSKLPQFDVAATVAATRRQVSRLDLAAGLLQVIVVLAVAAFAPQRV